MSQVSATSQRNSPLYSFLRSTPSACHICWGVLFPLVGFRTKLRIIGQRRAMLALISLESEDR